MKSGKRIQFTRPNRINKEIKAKEVRLIGVKNNSNGIVSIREALYLAKESGVDLVEISPHAHPPVCQIMDYGKFLYKKSKTCKEKRKKQKIVHIKEIKFRPSTEKSDYQVKIRNITRFLTEGNKVKITLRFRGREMAHQKLGMDLLNRVKKDLNNLSIVEIFPTKIENRQLIMLLCPKKK